MNGSIWAQGGHQCWPLTEAEVKMTNTGKGALASSSRRLAILDVSVAQGQ